MKSFTTLASFTSVCCVFLISLMAVPRANAQTAISNDGVVFSDNTEQTTAAGTFGTANNTRVGTSTLSSITTGVYNSANGVSALQDNATGSYNTGSGHNALRSNIDGDNNTAFGNYSLFSNTSGQYNIALGDGAGYFTTGSYNIAIGNGGVAAESGTIRIGDDAFYTGAFIAGIRGVSTGIGDAISVLIDSAGQLGTVSSSRRFKEEITEMTAASEPLLALRPVTFRYKEAYENGDKPIQYGLIAEEVAEQFPELVTFNEEGQPETVKYRLLSVLLLNELQKQNELNRQQESLLTELQGQVAELDELVRNVANMGYTEKNAVAMNATD